MVLYADRVAFALHEAACAKDELEAIPSSRGDRFAVADADQAVFGEGDDGAGCPSVEVILNQFNEEVIFV